MDDQSALVDNVFKLACSASDEQWQHGMYWYASAHSYAAGLAEEFGCPMETAVGVIAALSPRVEWNRNMTYARMMFDTNNAPVLNANKDKARRIIAGENPVNVLGGDKVNSFYDNILNPGTSDAVTIDRHACDAAMGSNGDDDSRDVLQRKGGYERFAQAYRDVAAMLAISPSQCQAIVWDTWKDSKVYELPQHAALYGKVA